MSRRSFTAAAGTVAIGLASAGAGLWPDAANAADPVWTQIPGQKWAVGVPVFLDLSRYVSDPDGDLLSFSLSESLPAGLSLNGSVISGTPTGTVAPKNYVATASESGSGQAKVPNPATNLIAQ